MYNIEVFTGQLYIIAKIDKCSEQEFAFTASEFDVGSENFVGKKNSCK